MKERKEKKRKTNQEMSLHGSFFVLCFYPAIFFFALVFSKKLFGCWLSLFGFIFSFSPTCLGTPYSLFLFVRIQFKIPSHIASLPTPLEV